MTPAQLQAYLGFLNKSNPPAALGDSFLGGPVGLPSPFPPYFDVTAPVFGAKGDSNLATDDSVAIQAAIDAAYNVTGGNAVIGVFIPDAPVQADGSPGFYNLKSGLTVHKSTHLFGAGMWTTVLNFPNDTSGIISSSNNNRVHLERLTLIGNGPLSSSATATQGIYVNQTNRWLIRDVYVQDFVDALVFDAGTIGNALHEVHNFWTYNTSYPNATNGYPRYGIRMTGTSSTRVQGVRIGGGSTISGVTDNQAQVYTGDGTTTTFNIQISAAQPLYQESGIKVYQIESGGTLVPYVSGTDYNIYNFGTGSNVLIPTGSSGSKATNINVIFGTAPANGVGIRIEQTDPTMLIGLYMDRANGNSIELTQIQGAQTLCCDVLGGNTVHLAEVEICNTVFALAGASYGEYTHGHAETSTQRLYSTSSPGSTGNSYIVSDRGAGWGWTETKATSSTGTQTFTGASAHTIAVDNPASGAGAGTLQFNEQGWSNREVQVELTVGLTNSSGGPAQATFTLQVSYDKTNTWNTLGTFDVGAYCSSSSTFTTAVSQSFQDRQDGGVLPAGASPTIIYYRMQVTLVSGSSVEVIGSGSYTYRLRARDVNRPGD